MTDDMQKTIRDLLAADRIVLFIKGTKTYPQDGSSARAVEIFKMCGTDFKDVNVLNNPALAQGVKEFSNWPTLPHAYINGNFIGGTDVLQEMYDSGELQRLLAS